MSNLGNQYISSSYQSVLNVGTGSGDYVTSTLKPLTDGYGTAVPIKVSTTGVELSGSISLTGSLVSSIIPAVSNSIDLGSPTKPFRHLYVGSGSIYLDDHQILSLDTPGTDTTIAAPPSGTVQLINDVIFSSQEGLGYEGAAGFTIVGGGTSFVSETKYSGDTISYHTGSHYLTNYWVNNQNVITGDTSLELELFKDNLKLATVENSRHLPTYYDSQYEINSIYEGTGSFNGAIRLKHTDLVGSEYSEISVGDDYVQMAAGNLSGSSPIPKSGFVLYENQVGGFFTNSPSSASFTLTGSLFEVTGAIKATDGYIGNVQGTASFASNANSASYASTALSASFAQNSDVANSALSAISADTLAGTGSAVFATTGSNTFNGSQTISGSLNVTGSITALSASITYLQTVYQTSSVIFTSGSNILGDEASDVQTLNGTVNVPLGNLNVTGATTASAGFFGNLQGTASYASNALSASQAANSVLLNGTGSGVFATTGSNQFIGQQNINGNINIDASNTLYNQAFYASSGSQNINMYFPTYGANTQPTIFFTGKNSYLQASDNLYFENAPGGSGTGSIFFATNGDINYTTNGTGRTININNANGVVNVSGSQFDVNVINANLTGSLKVSGSATITGSLDVRNGNLDLFSNNTTVNTDLYLTNSLAGQSNIIKGWGDSPTVGGAGAVQANYTGSLRITGSNNTVSMPQLRATFFGGAVDLQGYISGSDNTIAGNNAGIFMNTGSLLFPKTQNNILGGGGSILMNFTTSSLSGGHPTFANNMIAGGQINIQHLSGSVSVVQNNIFGGGITSTQNFVTNTRPGISSNNIIGSVTLNHISSSINLSNNYINTTAFNVNNAVSSSITNNSVGVTNNVIFGGSGNNPINIFASGSQNTNASRLFSDSIIGGRNVTVSSSFVSSSNSQLISSLIVGNGLTVSGSHTAGTNGGSAFVGRFNDTGSGLHLAQDIVFGVGTGTAAGSRRTGLYVTSGSLVGISGSLDVKGNSTMTGSIDVSGSVTIANAGDLTMYGHKMFNAGEFWSNTTQSGSAGVSGSINFNNSGSIAGLSLVSGSRLTVANAGTYNIQFSAQIETSAGADSAYVWFKKNGTNIGDSATKVTLANNTAQVMTVNILDEAAANDYYELTYQFTNGNATLLAEAASGNIPAIPSVIATVTQAR